MNRIEQIKESFDKWEDGYGLSSNDIEYLLQRLERYETSLKAIAEFKAGNALIHVQTLKQVAEEALKEE